MSLENFPKILATYNKDEYGNIILEVKKEDLVISANNNIAVLSFTPDEFNGISIPGMQETYDTDNLEPNQFKVLSYLDGKVQFHSSKQGQTIRNVSYQSKGLELLSASRIFTVVDDKGDVVDTLENLLKRGQDEIRILDNVGNAYDLILRLENDIKNGNEIQAVIGQADVLNESLKVQVPKAERIEPLLESENVEANRIYPLLEVEVDSGNVLLPQLTNKNAECGETLTNLTSKNEESSTILTNLTNKNTESANIITSLTNKNEEANTALGGLTNKTAEANTVLANLINKIVEGNTLKNTIQTSMDVYLRYYRDVAINTFVVNANSYIDKVITCNGVVLKDVINNINFNAFLPIGIRIEFYVSAANKISIRFYNSKTTNVTIPNVLAYVSVTKNQTN